MTTVLIIIATLAVDWFGAWIITYVKKKQRKRDEDILRFKIEYIFKNANLDITTQIKESIDICMMTEGDFAGGIYFILDLIHDYVKLESK